MKIVIYMLGLVLLASLQIGFLGGLRPFGVIPNLILVMVVLCGVHSTASRTVATALVGGLLLDLSSGQDFGLWMAFLTFLALVITFIRQLGFDMDTIWMVVSLSILATLVSSLVLLAGIGLQEVLAQAPATLRLIFLETLINTFLAAVGHLTLMALGGGAARGEEGLRKRNLLWQK